jgi:hypothetical protein
MTWNLKLDCLIVSMIASKDKVWLHLNSPLSAHSYLWLLMHPFHPANLTFKILPTLRLSHHFTKVLAEGWDTARTLISEQGKEHPLLHTGFLYNKTWQSWPTGVAVFIGGQWGPFPCILPVTAFILQWQSWFVTQDRMTHKAGNIYGVVLYRKSCKPHSVGGLQFVPVYIRQYYSFSYSLQHFVIAFLCNAMSQQPSSHSQPGSPLNF